MSPLHFQPQWFKTDRFMKYWFKFKGNCLTSSYTWCITTAAGFPRSLAALEDALPASFIGQSKGWAETHGWVKIIRCILLPFLLRFWFDSFKRLNIHRFYPPAPPPQDSCNLLSVILYIKYYGLMSMVLQCGKWCILELWIGGELSGVGSTSL